MSADAESKDKVAETPVPQTSNEGTAAPQLGPDGEPVQTKSAGKLAAIWENDIVITTCSSVPSSLSVRNSQEGCQVG